ncbi:MAG: hypothetical protein HY836_12740 [Aquabacterium sp.]|uniref:hypothetical protein n=1 Tax=Aquabacterium sp. TaxID=1872578 RepID=UPI0025BC1060|nr:hypothetical protein [Aquabacterium sp.]MBI5926449.1 hypothetical protein [Aquabacterium sp.]
MQEQVATQIQLLASAQLIRHPWMRFDKLFRFIVAADRATAVRANAVLLESIGQSVAIHLTKTSAFAFPCEQGLVVIVPFEVMRCALAPDNEMERQYGLTTVWHELAHVHALTLQYYPDGLFQPILPKAVRGSTNQAWHEFFADKHSHWQGFVADLEVHLLRSAWHDVLTSPSEAIVDHFMVRLASTHGRMSANGFGSAMATPRTCAAFESNDMVDRWRVCQSMLDDLCAQAIQTGIAPDLTVLEASLGNVRAALPGPNL